MYCLHHYLTGSMNKEEGLERETLLVDIDFSFDFHGFPQAKTFYPSGDADPARLTRNNF
jgi:hypothetical protein